MQKANSWPFAGARYRSIYPYPELFPNWDRNKGWQKSRIQRTKEQLENTLLNIEEITCHVGYEDSRTFRRLFKKYTGVSPREYRDRFLLLEDQQRH